MNSFRKGLFFVLTTALISGISIFLNSFAVASFEPSLFTTLKNIVVAVFLFSLFFLLKDLKELKLLSRKNWIQLMTIGLIGGSIPFLLFFNALAYTTAINAAFLHKLLFVFVAFLAVVFLKERINKKVLLASLLLLLSVILLFGVSLSSFSFFDLMILAATLLWATENIISKKVLNELSAKTVAFGRMFFGSLFLMVFLLSTGKISLISTLTLNHFPWLMLTSIFLFAYVFTWYNGLKRIPASLATSILLLGLPVTALLNSFFLSKTLLPLQLISYFILFSGIILLIKFQEKMFFLNQNILGVKK
ncbi:MAG: DMT family transporter [archaeon]